MAPLEAVLFTVGVACVIYGADLLVLGGSRLAAGLGISPLVVGLTIIAFGTGAPELAVSVKAAILKESDISLGNVIGSNIANVMLVLGLAAVLTPVAVSGRLIRRDAPIMVAVSVLLFVVCLDGNLSRFDGGMLLVIFAVYTFWSVRKSRELHLDDAAGEGPPLPQPKEQGVRGQLKNVIYLIIGLALLFAGSQWIVTGAISLAQFLGISQLVISLTIVALSTSLPEVATTVVAGLRKEADIGVGNIVGSNIFNILAVLGSAALFDSDGLGVASQALSLDIPVMTLAAVACLVVCYTESTIQRWEGGLFLAYYVLYTVYLILYGTGHPAVSPLGYASKFFVIPISLFVFALTVYLHRQRERRKLHSQS